MFYKWMVSGLKQLILLCHKLDIRQNVKIYFKIGRSGKHIYVMGKLDHMVLAVNYNLQTELEC